MWFLEHTHHEHVYRFKLGYTNNDHATCSLKLLKNLCIIYIFKTEKGKHC